MDGNWSGEMFQKWGVDYREMFLTRIYGFFIPRNRDIALRSESRLMADIDESHQKVEEGKRKNGAVRVDRNC